MRTIPKLDPGIGIEPNQFDIVGKAEATGREEFIVDMGHLQNGWASIELVRPEIEATHTPTNTVGSLVDRYLVPCSGETHRRRHSTRPCANNQDLLCHVLLPVATMLFKACFSIGSLRLTVCCRCPRQGCRSSGRAQPSPPPASGSCWFETWPTVHQNGETTWR